MLDTILDYLRTPLLVLSGTPITALTLFAAIAIVIVARIIAAVIGRSLERVLEARGLDKGMRHAVGKITRYAIVIIGIVIALSTMGVNMSAVMGAGAVLLVGIGFGLQKLAENFISGLLLLIERPVRKGDFVDIGGVLGTVDDIGLRATRVISRDGVTVIVPNSMLITDNVINHSVPTTSQRIWIKVGVAYDTDLDYATHVLLGVADAEAMVQKEPAPEVRHQGFGDSSIDLALACWVHDGRDDMLVTSKLRFAISRAFRSADIKIPSPQREIHIHDASRAA